MLFSTRRPAHPSAHHAVLAVALVFVPYSLARIPQARDLPRATFDGQVTNVPLTMEHGLELYQKWSEQMISSMFSIVANNKLKQHSKYVADEYGKCTKVAKSVPVQAKCLSRLLKGEMTGRLQFLKKKATVEKTVSTRFQRYRYQNPIAQQREWTGGFRVMRHKRHIASRPTYELRTPSSGLSPLGSVAKLLMHTILQVKNKTESTAWQRTVTRLRGVMSKRREIRKRKSESSAEQLHSFIFRGMKRDAVEEDDLDDVIRSPKRLKNFITGRRSRPSKDPVEKVMRLVHEGVKIGYSLAGQNVSDFDQKSLKIVSPRMFSVVAEESDDKTVDLLSPSLFSLHNEGKGIENLTSIPNLVKAFGDTDRQQWMDLILEAAGVNDNAEMLERDLEEEAKASHSHIERYKREFRAPNGTPLYLTKENVTERFGEFERRKIETFEKLEATYTKEQMKEMNQTGFAILTPAQLYMLYGPQSPYNSSSTLSRLLQLNRTGVHEGIEADVHSMAKAEQVHVRHKRDITLSPIVLTPIVLSPKQVSQPIVLSPVVLSPLILSPAIFGPVILSPWVFVPLVLSPRLLSPLILSPPVLSPIILTPLALHPIILSPGVLNPLILTPAVLTPVILSPQVFTPFILSPIALSPLILNPMVGSPLVLSPFVLSPIIVSPMALSALVLSPYALSPIILSPLISFHVSCVSGYEERDLLAVRVPFACYDPKTARAIRHKMRRNKNAVYLEEEPNFHRMLDVPDNCRKRK